MTEAAKEARRAYRREWARKNPDKVRASQERYWLRRAEEVKRQTEKQPETEVGDIANF